MKTDGRRSENIEDRRGKSGSRGKLIAGGGIGAVILGIVIALISGQDPTTAISTGAGTGDAQADGEAGPRPEWENALADFTAVVLADTEDTWNPLFDAMGREYEEPVLVLFTEGVDSACGFQTSAVGPFYCPGDNQVYIDLTFFKALDDRFGAPGDFAQAYVIAHEVGHHIQNLLGASTRVHKQKQRVGEVESNQLSVRLELQADCYAGVWAHHAKKARNVVESGDIEEALEAARVIGDDALQRNAGVAVQPETFTHGTSEQRRRWFDAGFKGGQVDSCDTFAGDYDAL